MSPCMDGGRCYSTLLECVSGKCKSKSKLFHVDFSIISMQSACQLNQVFLVSSKHYCRRDNDCASNVCERFQCIGATSNITINTTTSINDLTCRAIMTSPSNIS